MSINEKEIEAYVETLAEEEAGTIFKLIAHGLESRFPLAIQLGYEPKIENWVSMEGCVWVQGGNLKIGFTVSIDKNIFRWYPNEIGYDRDTLYAWLLDKIKEDVLPCINSKLSPLKSHTDILTAGTDSSFGRAMQLFPCSLFEKGNPRRYNFPSIEFEYNGYGRATVHMPGWSKPYSDDFVDKLTVDERITLIKYYSEEANNHREVAMSRSEHEISRSLIRMMRLEEEVK